MAEGQEIRARKNVDLTSLGRSLTRRAGSRCELCDSAGVPLSPVEVPPYPEEPDADHAVLLCRRCREGATGRKLDGADWRFLERAAWSDVPAVQVIAVLLARRLRGSGVGWAREILDSLYLAPEVEHWLRSAT
jgi:protein PhnA